MLLKSNNQNRQYGTMKSHCSL